MMLTPAACASALNTYARSASWKFRMTPPCDGRTCAWRAATWSRKALTKASATTRFGRMVLRSALAPGRSLTNGIRSNRPDDDPSRTVGADRELEVLNSDRAATGATTLESTYLELLLHFRRKTCPPGCVASALERLTQEAGTLFQSADRLHWW